MLCHSSTLQIPDAITSAFLLLLLPSFFFLYSLALYPNTRCVPLMKRLPSPLLSLMISDSSLADASLLMLLGVSPLLVIASLLLLALSKLLASPSHSSGQSDVHRSCPSYCE